MAVWHHACGRAAGRFEVSKITNVRLPNATQTAYSPEQFNQLVRSLEQVILQLNNTYTPVVSEDKDQAQTWFMGN